MEKNEYDLIQEALRLLHRLVPDDKTYAVDAAPKRCPVLEYAQHFLRADPASDLTTLELWWFYEEVVTAGKIQPISKTQFLRRLPGAMEMTFSAKKSHAIKRESQLLRGFKGIDIRRDACPVPWRKIGEMPIEPDVLDEPDLDPRPKTFDPRAPTIIDAQLVGLDDFTPSG